MHLVRGRLAVLCAFVVLLQLSVLGMAAVACRSGCEMNHAMAEAAECHETAQPGAHCPMPEYHAPNPAAASVGVSLGCDCDDSRAVDLLLSPTALLVSGTSVAADVTLSVAPPPALESLLGTPPPPFIPPPRA